MNPQMHHVLLLCPLGLYVVLLLPGSSLFSCSIHSAASYFFFQMRLNLYLMWEAFPHLLIFVGCHKMPL